MIYIILCTWLLSLLALSIRQTYIDADKSKQAVLQLNALIAEHQVEVTRFKNRIQCQANDYKRLEAELPKAVVDEKRKLGKLIDDLSVIVWERDNHSRRYRFTIEFDVRLMDSSDGRGGRHLIAEHLMRRVEDEILSSRFVVEARDNELKRLRGERASFES